jgi:hypothetical protein
MDERLMAHRYKSTSLGAMAGGFLMGAWIVIDLMKTGAVRTDFMIVLGVMAVTKLSVLAWLQLRD